MIITYEGIEACGKGKQIEKTAAYLRSKGIEYFINQEPGGRAQGLMRRMTLKSPLLSAIALNEAFKDLQDDYPQIPLIDRKIEPATPEQEILDFVYSRVGNTLLSIAPALREGKVILSDRHLHSTLAFQGYGKYSGDKRILNLIETLHDLMIFPYGQIDRTFYLDITYEEQEKRKALIKGRDPNDIFENQKRENFERIIEGYRTMAREDPRVMLIDGMRNREEVFEQIKPELDRLLRL